MYEGVEIDGVVVDISNRLCEYLNSLPTDSYRDKFRTNVLNQSVKVPALIVNITTDELDEYEKARIIKKIN